MKSLCLRSSWEESALTKDKVYNPSHKWKMVDITPTAREMGMIEKFIKSNGMTY